MNTVAMSLPKEDVRTRVNTTLGMIFFIGSWTMSFGTLFLAFMVLRQRVGVWPPEGIALPSFPMASAATVVLIASSFALHRAVKAIESGATSIGRDWILGLALGLGFAGLQAWLWLDLMAAGRGPASGLYESLFYGLTWVHALHVVVGFLSLLWAWSGLATGRYGAHRSSTVSNIVIFWHFVDVVWIVLYMAFFIF
ncbi:MAG: cytochrome c oxidase subunit 3 [Candidatus Paceibacteria bacterium]|jgi:cytochrome c oxidase subunit 3